MARSFKEHSRPVALVTGGASFLGRAISLHLAREGFDLAVHFQRSGERAKRLVKEIEGLGVKAFAVKADLGDVSRAPNLIRSVVRSFRRLDLLVNSASLFYPTPLANAKPGQWEELFNVNLFAPYFLSRAAAPWLKKNSGSIVNLTDIYGENPILKDHSAYCASKAGLITLTKILARELGPLIRVNAVSPGAILIPKSYSAKKKRELLERSALKRQGTPNDIAEAVCFLASQSFVTGQVLKVDGGRFLN